ncbi:MAG TPA: glutathionylspermidine synthase family protein [Armatimonadota bacterium]|nr:glutathionylspermidine synthase family protein [Armatimonadota bacterium]
MQRILTTPRRDWEKQVANYGLTFHTINDETYWDESGYYHFTPNEVDMLDDVTTELHRMCLEAVEYIIHNNLFDKFLIPKEFVPLVKASWEQAEKSLYGRFDFVYDGVRPPKLLEYNADTPTALLEASVIQWYWLQDVNQSADQFNSIHEKLLDRFKEIGSLYGSNDNRIFYFAAQSESEEDYMTVNYLRDVAMQAGFQTEYLDMQEIGWNSQNQQFTDLEERNIHWMFKLYPWEWMVNEDFGQYLLLQKVRFFEPIWKMVLSNKAILPILWELYPHHPNLLRAEWEPFGETYVKKPLLSREGANITIVSKGNTLYETQGDYGDSPCIYQEWCPLPNFYNNYPVIGSWVVGDTACGIGIREDNSPITKDTSRFIPHLFA